MHIYWHMKVSNKQARDTYRHTPVFFAIFSSSSGYLVSLCISMGMMSLSCSLRHWGLLSASWHTHTHTVRLEHLCHILHYFASAKCVHVCLCSILGDMFVCMWYLYENVEAWISLLPGLDLVQGPWLVAAEPCCQFLEPLPLCTTKLKHTCTHKHYNQWLCCG